MKRLGLLLVLLVLIVDLLLPLNTGVTQASTLNPQVAASADDADEGMPDLGTHPTDLDTEMRASNDGNEMWGGFRWVVSIPQNATITTAYLSVYIPSSTYDDADINLHFQLAAAPTAFTTATHDISTRTRTTNSTSWVANSIGTGWHNSPSLVTPLQELVNAYSVTSIVLIAKPNTDVAEKILDVASYDGDSAHAPKLYVIYSVPTAPTITTNNATYIAGTSARLNSYLSSDGGEACDVRFQYGTATGNYTYSTDWVNDTYTTGNYPYADVTTLTTNTTYYFRAQAANSVGSANGSELSFTTTNETGAPTNFVAYPSSTSISLSWTKGSGATNTRVQRQIGSYPTTVNGSLDIGAVATNRTSSLSATYTCIDADNPANATGIINTIEVWAATNLTNLVVGTFYNTTATSFTCRDSEMVGNVTAGSMQIFTNLTINVMVGDYIGKYSGGGISLDTTGGAGIYIKIDNFANPGAQADYIFVSGYAISLYGIGTTTIGFTGIQVYFGTMATATDIGLTPGTSYYYSAWGESGGNYSATHATVMTTTSAGEGAPGVPGAPETPSGWFGAPDYTRLSGLPLLYPVLNAIADDYGMPRNSFWVVITLLGITILSLFIYLKSQSAVASTIVGGVLIVIASISFMGLLWMLLAFIVIAAGVFAQVRQM